MSNRQQRRHPNHHTVPIQYPSKKRIVDKDTKGETKSAQKSRRSPKKPG